MLACYCRGYLPPNGHDAPPLDGQKYGKGRFPYFEVFIVFFKMRNENELIFSDLFYCAVTFSASSQVLG